jgi:hypothetical protein
MADVSGKGAAAAAAAAASSAKQTKKKKKVHHSWEHFRPTASSEQTGHRSIRNVVFDVAAAFALSQKTGNAIDLDFLTSPNCYNPSVLGLGSFFCFVLQHRKKRTLILLSLSLSCSLFLFFLSCAQMEHTTSSPAGAQIEGHRNGDRTAHRQRCREHSEVQQRPSCPNPRCTRRGRFMGSHGQRTDARKKGKRLEDGRRQPRRQQQQHHQQRRRRNHR